MLLASLPGRDQGCCQTSYKAQDSPLKNYSVRSVNSAEAEKLCSTESPLTKVIDDLNAKPSGLCRALMLYDLYHMTLSTNSNFLKLFPP